MSMGTHVTGFKPPDEKWKKMKAAYDACTVAGVAWPKEVVDFFGGEEPDENGVEISQHELEKVGAVLRIDDRSPERGFVIVIGKLPKDVKVVRFENSW